MDTNLVSILDKIYNSDQLLRKELNTIEQMYGTESKELRYIWKCIHDQDSENQKKITRILDEKGWLGQDRIGKWGNTTLFLVIQHSPIEIQKRYLPMMREAVIKNNAKASHLALLEDRVALRTNKRQIYGTQIYKDEETGKCYVAPLEDPKNVDEKRASIGLESLQEYLSNWGIAWNIKDHT